MKYYYAIFKTTSEAIEVSFPDLEGCVTFGENWDEALMNATDALAGWMAHAEPKFIVKPSSHNTLEKKLKNKENLVPIHIDKSIIESYQESKRFNVMFPKNILEDVDKYRKKAGLKRSTLLQLAAKEYLDKHSNSHATR